MLYNAQQARKEEPEDIPALIVRTVDDRTLKPMDALRNAFRMIDKNPKLSETIMKRLMRDPRSD